MLTALYQDKTIYIEQMEPDQLKRLSDTQQLLCPDCYEPLIYKTYQERLNHFAHRKSDCTYPFREAESIEHEKGKKTLYEWLKTQFEKDDCFIEQHIPATNQRADTFVSSLQTAVEFQCSVIQESTWKARTNLYRQANVQDFWILGYSMHKRVQENNRFLHKFNALENALFNTYGKLVYFDVLSKQFVFLLAEEKLKNQWLGTEYFFKPSEVFLRHGVLETKYDYFLTMQRKRSSFVNQVQKQAKQTDVYLKELKEEASEAKQILASKKQINYIKYLLYQEGKTIPYKLHGLKREEADVIIKKLIGKNEVAP